MHMQPNLEQVVEILKKEGLSDNQIRGFIEGLTKSLAAQMYTEMVSVLSEDEMKDIEKMVSDRQREVRMLDIFKKKTGKDAQEIANKFVEIFTTEFLKNYQENQNNSEVSTALEVEEQKIEQ